MLDDRTLVNVPWSTSSLLPTGVAYSVDLIDTMTRHLKLPGCAAGTVPEAFEQYPMNFAMRGARREAVEMRDSEVVAWQNGRRRSKITLHNRDPCDYELNEEEEETETEDEEEFVPENGAPQTPFQEPKRGHIATSVPPVTNPEGVSKQAHSSAPHKPISAAEAYENLKKSFADRKGGPSARIKELESEVEEYKEKTSILDQKYKKLASVARRNRVKLEEQVAKGRADLRAAKQENKALRKELEEANGQLVEAWEMRMAEEAEVGSGKRKAEDDAAGGEGKKAKMGG